MGRGYGSERQQLTTPALAPELVAAVERARAQLAADTGRELSACLRRGGAGTFLLVNGVPRPAVWPKDDAVERPLEVVLIDRAQDQAVLLAALERPEDDQTQAPHPDGLYAFAMAVLDGSAEGIGRTGAALADAATQVVDEDRLPGWFWSAPRQTALALTRSDVRELDREIEYQIDLTRLDAPKLLAQARAQIKSAGLEWLTLREYLQRDRSGMPRLEDFINASWRELQQTGRLAVRGRPDAREIEAWLGGGQITADASAVVLDPRGELAAVCVLSGGRDEALSGEITAVRSQLRGQGLGYAVRAAACAQATLIGARSTTLVTHEAEPATAMMRVALRLGGVVATRYSVLEYRRSAGAVPAAG